jgi:hypothetical protein
MDKQQQIKHLCGIIDESPTQTEEKTKKKVAKPSEEGKTSKDKENADKSQESQELISSDGKWGIDQPSITSAPS